MARAALVLWGALVTGHAALAAQANDATATTADPASATAPASAASPAMAPAVPAARPTTASVAAATKRPATAASTPRPAGADGPSWASLTAAQRQALAPLERDWASIEAPRKAKWLDVAGRMPTLSAEEQQRIRERMVEWARMTPTERGRARLTFLDSKQLSADEKQARWEAYRSLPEAERQALAARQRAAERSLAASGSTAASGIATTARPGAPVQPPTDTAAKPWPGATTASPGRVAPSTTPAATPGVRAATAARTAASAPPPKPVSPSLVQGKPGATTVLMNRQPAPPPHQQPGQPRIAVNAADVDPQTLLPRNGPQAASAPMQALRP